jgi:asparagine synthase (glutamine-hydrolysing)
VGFKFQSILAPEFLTARGGADPHLDLLEGLDVRGQLRGRAPVHQSMYLWSKTALPNYILSVLGDRMEMANSVEGRLPFLDHHLVELVRSLPVSAKIRGTTEKHVLREAARPVLTDTVYRRQKHPFLAPPSAAAPGSSLHELLQATLRGSALERVPFFDRQRVLTLLDSWPEHAPSARAAVDALLVQVLTLCILGERFGLS